MYSAPSKVQASMAPLALQQSEMGPKEAMQTCGRAMGEVGMRGRRQDAMQRQREGETARERRLVGGCVRGRSSHALGGPPVRGRSSSWSVPSRHRRPVRVDQSHSSLFLQPFVCEWKEAKAKLAASEEPAMAEVASAPAAAASGEATGKMTMVVAVDDSEHSFYALQWALQHFFPSEPAQQQYRLAVVTAKPTAASAVGLAGPGAADVLPFVEADLRKSSLRVIDKVKELCAQVTDAVYEVVEGDPRNVLCEAVERHHAEMLVVGSHGYGAIKRYKCNLIREIDGCAWECQRLLCPSCTLHCDDSKEAKAQALRYGLL
ncbi:hypothetical protein EJB05_01205, partial [Eragrostis curvula]